MFLNVHYLPFQRKLGAQKHSDWERACCAVDKVQESHELSPCLPLY